jgi:DNA-binding transcriptional LysR family regulator
VHEAQGQTWKQFSQVRDLRFASWWMFAPELKSGEVTSVLDEWTLRPMDLWVIYPSGRLRSANARAFIKWFEKTISQAV